MQWIQTRYVDDAYQRFQRFKCNRCGTTAEIPYDLSDSSMQMPTGWNLGSIEGAHLCPVCETKPLKKALLPILH